MLAEILSVGTELLMGQIANTDAQYLSRRLAELGVTVRRHTTVGDNPGRVKAALGEALGRADIVITTGGLGPTEDDLTKETVAEYFGLRLCLDAESLAAIEARMAAAGQPMAENSRKQALLPEGARILRNDCGTAPGCVVEYGGKAVAVLPGPPRELKAMFETGLAPWLAARSGAHIESRYVHIFGIGEPRLEDLLIDLFHSDDPTLALYCAPGEITARVTARAADAATALSRIAPVEAELRRRLGSHVYGEGMDLTIESAVFERLRARGERVTFAESCTGGLLASRLVAVPGCSEVLGESYVTYAESAKARILGVSEETLRAHTAVSEPCAREMAEGARRVSGADWAVSVTGYAGPDGGTAEHPVGTVFIGVAGKGVSFVKGFCFRGDRTHVRTLAASHALNLLRLALDGALEEA